MRSHGLKVTHLQSSLLCILFVLAACQSSKTALDADYFEVSMEFMERNQYNFNMANANRNRTILLRYKPKILDTGANELALTVKKGSLDLQKVEMHYADGRSQTFEFHKILYVNQKTPLMKLKQAAAELETLDIHYRPTDQTYYHPELILLSPAND